MALSSSGQDGALSRHKLGFESRQGHSSFTTEKRPRRQLRGFLVPSLFHAGVTARAAQGRLRFLDTFPANGRASQGPKKKDFLVASTSPHRPVGELNVRDAVTRRRSFAGAARGLAGMPGLPLPAAGAAAYSQDTASAARHFRALFFIRGFNGTTCSTDGQASDVDCGAGREGQQRLVSNRAGHMLGVQSGPPPSSRL
jgi:hypothetical protein